MKIVSAHEKTVALSSSMRNAGIAFAAMTASALALVSDVTRGGKPVVGLAFDSIGRYGHGGLLRERFLPRLLNAEAREYRDEARDNVDPFKVWGLVMRDEKPGGHGERPAAVGLIDAALWDLVAKIEGKPLWRVLADRFHGGDALTRVPVYASGGHYRPTNDLAELGAELKHARALGYTRMKIKIGGAPLADDRRRIETALGILGGGKALAVDCNASLSREAAQALLAALAPYDLAWVEEPVDPLDYESYAALAAGSKLSIGTGENIFSAADTRNLLRYAGLRPDRDWLQMDISLSYGIVEYLRILARLEEHGWSRTRCLPHAGHFLSLHAVAGLGLGGHEAAPDAASLFGGYADGTLVEEGFVRPGDAPGVGIEAKANLYAIFRDMLA
jgi:D(-)-tartrate dehydratase